MCVVWNIDTIHVFLRKRSGLILAYNRGMRVRGTAYQEAIENLPPGAILVLQDVPWEDYEHLLDDIGNRRPGLRITYDRGRLEVMSPLFEHEQYKEFVLQLLRVLAEERQLTLESAGSTTWKRKRAQSGIEPDTSFYIASAPQIIGRKLDPQRDPPPDLAVEIDVTNESLSRLPLYAALVVPEVWRYSSKRSSLSMYELREGSYVEISASRSFPMLMPEVLAGFIEKCANAGQTEALAEFRRWVRDQA